MISMIAPARSSRFEDRMGLRFQVFEDHLEASLDRFERDILNRLDQMAAAFTLAAVLSIVGTSLTVGLVLIPALL